LISKDSDIIEAESKSIFEFIFTIIPFFINSAINFGKTTQIFSDNSFRDNISGTVIVSPFFSTKFCLISSIFFSSFVFTLFDLVKVTSFSSLKLNLHLVFHHVNFDFFSLFQSNDCHFDDFLLLVNFFASPSDDFFLRVKAGFSDLFQKLFLSLELFVLSDFLIKKGFLTGLSSLFTTDIF